MGSIIANEELIVYYYKKGEIKVIQNITFSQNREI